MLSGKKVLVLGLAKSGRAAVMFLEAMHATITVNEAMPRENISDYDDLIARGIEMVVGEHPSELFERDYDFVVKNPGINYQQPFVLRLKQRGIPVYTEIEMVARFSKPQNYIAITGTNGKTTTVSLIEHILKCAQRQVCLAGNVGTPLATLALTMDMAHKSGYDVVLEMSNFQLLDIDTFHPMISTIINLTPDHLDYMLSLDDYYMSKTRIYMNQNEKDVFIENKDDHVLQEYLQKNPSRARRLTFSINEMADCMLKDDIIFYQEQKIIHIRDIRLKGQHNLQNIMIAICTCMEMGIDILTLHNALVSFQGVEHRIEFVREHLGVHYYNDSKATNTDATITALKAFERPVILLMGGYEKNLDLRELSTYREHISHLICFGAAKNRFANDMQCAKTIVVDHLADAIASAAALADAGDIVLLSPSTSSFDEFSSYEERGRFFKTVVNEM